MQMKIIKGLTIIGLAFITVQVSAQENKPEDALQTAQMHVEKLSKDISGLTNDQQSQMVGVENWFISSVQNARANNDNSDVVVARVKELSNERDKKMKTILTAEQYDKYMQIFAAAAK